MTPRDPLGRFAPAPADVGRLAALRAELEACRGMPPAWRALLLTELAALLDASDRLWREPLAGGVTTRRGRLRAPYRVTRELADRIATISRLLGLDGDAANGKPAKPTPEEAMAAVRRAIAEANAAKPERGE